MGALSVFPGLSTSSDARNHLAPPTEARSVTRMMSIAARAPSFQPEVAWEFPREKLYIRYVFEWSLHSLFKLKYNFDLIRRKITDGKHCEVWRAQAEGILGCNDATTVAVKMPRGEEQ